MSTPSLLALQQAVDPGRWLLRAAISLDYPNKPNALNGVTFDIAPGEILGLIGESGSGKSSVALSLMRLLRTRNSRLTGSIQFEKRQLLSASERDMRNIRGREISLVLQSPLAALNPALRIGVQFEEAWKAHRKASRDEMRLNIARTIAMVSLPPASEILSLYPRELSVGLAQRVLIAMAILHGPKLLIADEPTSALDVITAAEILRLFARLNHELGMAILFISHDLLSIASLCDRIAIMRQGRIVECSSTKTIFSAPTDEYTRALVAALPSLPRTLKSGPPSTGTEVEQPVNPATST